MNGSKEGHSSKVKRTENKMRRSIEVKSRGSTLKRELRNKIRILRTTRYLQKTIEFEQPVEKLVI